MKQGPRHTGRERQRCKGDPPFFSLPLTCWHVAFRCSTASTLSPSFVAWGSGRPGGGGGCPAAAAAACWASSSALKISADPSSAADTASLSSSSSAASHSAPRAALTAACTLGFPAPKARTLQLQQEASAPYAWDLIISWK